jgi:hypothetical protein
MPNLLGGDQLHPAYLSRKLSANEVLIGNWLYRIHINKKGSVTVDREHVDGSGEPVMPEFYPPGVTKKIQRLLKKRQTKK